MLKLSLGLFLFLSTLSYAQDQMFDVCPLLVGEKLTTVAKIVDDQGESHALVDLIAEKKSVIVFFRGGWCPYCTRQLSGLQEIKSQMDSLGYNLIAITPDRFDSLKVTYREANNEFKLYSDSDLDVINFFGLGWEIDDKNYIKYRDQYEMDTEIWTGEKHHILPVPAVYVISDNVVQYNYVNPNYSVRLNPELLLSILKSIKDD